MVWNVLWHQSITQPFFKGLLIKKNHTVAFRIPIRQNGNALRLHMVNRYGSKAYPVEAAIHYGGTIYPLCKAGSSHISIPAKGALYTDEIPLHVTEGTELEIRIFYASRYRDCNAIEEDAQLFEGNALTSCDQTPLSPSETEQKLGVFRSVPFLDRIEVLSEQPSYNIVAFGDSITAMSRWTKPLAERLYRTYGSEFTLLNSGICGNCLTYELPGLFHDSFGEKGIDRYRRDILSIENVVAVILAFGINDISYMTPKRQSVVNLQLLFAETEKLTALLHEKGIRVVIQTLVPRKGYQTFTPEMEQMRQEYNTWVRTANIFDSVVDPEPLLLEEGTTDTFKSSLHQGDHLHPNHQGGMLIANTFDLSALVGK